MKRTGVKKKYGYNQVVCRGKPGRGKEPVKKKMWRGETEGKNRGSGEGGGGTKGAAAVDRTVE